MNPTFNTQSQHPKTEPVAIRDIGIEDYPSQGTTASDKFTIWRSIN